MKYKDLYPNINPIFEEAHDLNATVIKSRDYTPCHQCKEPTKCVDIDYEVPFCYQECLELFESFLK